MLKQVQDVADQWGIDRSEAGRELLLLGLSLVEGLAQQGILLPFMDLTEAFRKDNLADSKGKQTIKPNVITVLVPDKKKTEQT